LDDGELSTIITVKLGIAKTTALHKQLDSDFEIDSIHISKIDST